MRLHLAALLMMIPAFTACVAMEGDDEGDLDVETSSQEVRSINSCSYVAPSCETGWSLRVDFVGTADACYRAGIFGASCHEVLCPADHPVLDTRSGEDRCGSESCGSSS